METERPKATKCDCDAVHVLMVQYRGTREDYDGVSEYECTNCKRRWGRWTGEELQDGELEPRYGEKRKELTAAERGEG